MSNVAFACDAILFDLDGVLIDSAMIAQRQLRAWADHNGIAFSRVVSVYHGRTTLETIGVVAPHLDAQREAELLESAEAADTDGLVAFSGAARLLGSIPEHRWAIATSCRKATACSRLEHLGLPRPKVLIAAEDVAKGKPAPDAYLLAADRLGLPPSRCVVIEDAVAGIESARAAGARVIAVASTSPASALVGADGLVRRLDDIRLDFTSDSLVVNCRSM